MAEMEENKHGVFKQDLMRTFRQLKESRAESVSEDVEIISIEEGKSVAVVRFSGGPQAGHTVVNEGIEHICSSFGSGVLLGVPTYYTDDVFIDPIALYNERKVLQGKGIKETLVYASMFNRVITPYDVFAGREDNKVLSDGTCGMGIYPTFKRYNEGEGFGAWINLNTSRR